MYYDIVKSGERINGLRTARRMTRQQLAEHIGLSVDALRKIEAGVNGAKIDTLISIAELVEAFVSEIVFTDNNIEVKLLYDDFLKELLDVAEEREVGSNG